MIVRICLLATLLFYYIHCVIVVPERGNVTFWSDKYLYYARAYVTRKSRKSPYYVNIEGKTKHTWGNNITGHLIFYEYLHNEYRRTMIEIHLRGCDFFNKDVFVGRILRDRGYHCPYPPADIHLLNMTVPTDKVYFPLPFQKFRIECELTHTDTNEIIAKGYGMGSFKPK